MMILFDDDNEQEEKEDNLDAEKEKEFLSFVDDNNNIFLNMINSKESIIIDEIFLFIYESKINQLKKFTISRRKRLIKAFNSFRNNLFNCLS